MFDLRGTPGDQGLAHGDRLRDLGLLGSDFTRAYIEACGRVTRTEADDVRGQALVWLDALPAHYRDEIEGMARGARVPTIEAATFLYADIARPSAAGAEPEARWASPAADGGAGGLAGDLAGPMCSSVVCALQDGLPWVARNCDWLTCTLTRGTAGVCHRTPGRVATLGVGIRGDIDVDTGMNAAGLWLHLHTLYTVRDQADDGRERISWLFWCREALETCETLDELEAFIERTTRDRGVIAIAVEGRVGRAAAFECSRSTHVRRDLDLREARVITNHAIDKPIDQVRRAKARPGGTIARACRLGELLGEHPPEHGPDDLAEALGDAGVEMDRRAGSGLVRATGQSPISTIYSTACTPVGTRGEPELWFAAGGADGSPAASGGTWQRVGVPW